MRQDISRILFEAHERMKSQYLNEVYVNAEEANAQVLTNFFLSLKQRAISRKNSTAAERVGEDMYDLILDAIVLPNHRTIHNLFRRTGGSYRQGTYFEQDLAAVVMAVYKTINVDKKSAVSLSQINVSNQVGTVGQMIDGLSEEILQELKTLTKKELEKKFPHYVFGKIDTVIQHDLISIKGNSNIPDNILLALSQATFTDKSYKSYTWKNGQILDLGERTIKLGSSDLNRALRGAMSYLAFNEQDIESVYYGGQYLLAQNQLSDQNKAHFWHLRYLYELTGAGIIYKGGQNLGLARYLIYNDPSTDNIVVKSTAKILSELLQGMYESSNPFGSITLQSSTLGKMSKNQLK